MYSWRQRSNNNMKKQKIVLIGPVYPYKGGISHYTGQMCRELSKTNDVEMISYKMQYPKFLFHKEQRDYENDSFKVDKTKYLINTANPFNIIKTARYIKKLKPDKVIVQWWHPYFAPCYILLRWFMGRQKLIYVCHNVFPHERFPMDKKLTQLTLKGGKHYILHAKEEAKELLKIKKDARYTITPHPTYNMFRFEGMSKQEARKKIGISEDEKLLLFFGFVRPYKGLKHLLNAIPVINKKLEKVKLLVVGDFDNDRQTYSEIIERLGISSNVIIKDGYTPDREVEKYFAACDLVVLPYESATQSGIVQIAYGFEKPVVVTEVGGLPDVVTDQKTGYVVPPMQPQALADAIVRYYDENKEDFMIKNIKEEAYRFSWERMAEIVENI
ncbi:MAG: glycosyltransferase [Lachnospiraceae bacterium]|nr:glycosyltransferase [Lachnospiraceae bacterium]